MARLPVTPPFDTSKVLPVVAHPEVLVPALSGLHGAHGSVPALILPLILFLVLTLVILVQFTRVLLFFDTPPDDFVDSILADLLV